MDINGVRCFGWIVYATEKAKELVAHKCGKWMYFFNDQAFALNICEKAINENVCWECKCTDLEAQGTDTGVICFYLNCDDLEHHKSVIEFMLRNGLIRKTKNGSYYNISFKLDDQTSAGEYGADFEGKIKLSEFLDLDTGLWKE